MANALLCSMLAGWVAHPPAGQGRHGWLCMAVLCEATRKRH
jgi:hypothetical protein